MDEQRPPLRRLTEGELNAFREDYRDLEKEIQSFFRAYYLSGLILVAAWLMGPESKPLLELILGNGGYNIYAPMGIALLNMVSTIFLVYKSISIHEVMQFASYFSDSDSAINYWESWRRSSYNYAKFARPFYSPLLFIVPLGLSCLILIPTGRILYSKPQELIEQIKDYQVPPTSIESISSSQTIEPERKNGIEAELVKERKEYADSVSRIFPLARLCFWAIVALHLIPIWLAYFNAFIVPKRWRSLEQLRNWDQVSAELRSISSEGKSAIFSEDKTNASHGKEEQQHMAKASEKKSASGKGSRRKK